MRVYTRYIGSHHEIYQLLATHELFPLVFSLEPAVLCRLHIPRGYSLGNVRHCLTILCLVLSYQVKAAEQG